MFFSFGCSDVTVFDGVGSIHPSGDSDGRHGVGDKHE